MLAVLATLAAFILFQFRDTDFLRNNFVGFTLSSIVNTIYIGLFITAAGSRRGASKKSAPPPDDAQYESPYTRDEDDAPPPGPVFALFYISSLGIIVINAIATHEQWFGPVGLLTALGAVFVVVGPPFFAFATGFALRPLLPDGFGYFLVSVGAGIAVAFSGYFVVFGLLYPIGG